jgi:two-component sensor histidine kinase
VYLAQSQLYSFLVAVIIVFGSANLFGYDLTPQSRNYGVNEGLPSSQVYEIIQAENGYIWFGTDRGLVRYNGYEFKTYTTNDGLTSNVVFHLDEGPDNTIYCYGKDRKVHLVKNDQITPYEFNDIIYEKTHYTANVLDIIVNEKGLQINTIGGSYETVGLIQFDHEGVTLENKKFGVFIEENEFGLHIFGRYNHSIENISVFGKKTNYSFDMSSFSKFMSVVRFEDKIYFSIGTYLFRYQVGGEIGLEVLKNFDNDILDMQVDQFGHIYLGIRHLGLVKLIEGDITKSRSLIPGKNISSILIDKDYGIWASSLFDGLFYIKDEDVNQLALEGSKQVLAIEEYNHEIYVCTQGLQVFCFRHGQDNHMKLKKEDSNNFNYSGENKLTFLGEFAQEGIVIDMKEKESVTFTSVRSYFYRGDSLCKFLFGGLNITSTGKANYYYDVNEDVNCGIITEEFGVLLGTERGVKKINFSERVFDHDGISQNLVPFQHFSCPLIEYDLDCAFLRSRMHDMLNIGDSILLFGSAENGLLLRQKGLPDLILDEKNGLISNSIEHLYYKGNYLVAMSKKGMSIISRENGIQNYTRRNGLLSNDVGDALIRNDSVWAVTDRGMSIFPIKNQPNNAIPIYLTSFKVNNKNNSISDHYDLSYRDQSIDITFEALSYSQEGKIQYKYQLKGADDHWNFTQDRTVRYRNLPAGEYSFLVAARYPDGRWTAPIQFFSISKTKAFWQTWYFQTIAVLFGLGLIGWIALRRVKQIQQEEKAKLQVLNLERKTLQAQMNPHFIFNSLTSLQNLILKNDAELANEYLGKFARLTRIALLQSTENWVKLQDEINLLEHYVQLEQIRFPNHFKYQINLNSQANDVMIPPFLIQPFVENAILHGLTKRSVDGLLEIRIEEINDERLLFTVFDNGIGRSTANDTKTKRKSLGIRLIKERLKILLQEEAVEIIDLKDDAGKPIGTKVKIIVPRKSQ